MFVTRLRDCEHEAAAAAVADMCDTWTGNRGPSLGQFMEKYWAQVTLQQQRHDLLAVPSGTPGCNGSGFAADGAPCRRCCPVLWELSQQPDKWELYINGTPLYILHSGARRHMPPRCQTDTFHDREPDTFRDGVLIAAPGYADQCQQRGKRPDWRIFQKWIDSIPEPPEEPQPPEPF